MGTGTMETAYVEKQKDVGFLGLLFFFFFFCSCRHIPLGVAGWGRCDGLGRLSS